MNELIKNAMTIISFSYPLFEEYILYTKVIETDELPTFAGIELSTKEIKLYINSKLIEKNKLTQKDVVELLKHEYSHILLLHNFSRLPDNKKDNVACDLEINQSPWVMEDCFIEKYGVTYKKYRLEKEKSREWYYNNLNDPDKNGDGGSSGINKDGTSIDDHSGFSNSNDTVEQVWRQINQRILAKAEQQGLLPSDCIEKIKSKITRAPSLKKILKRIIGRCYHDSVNESISRLRPNRRFPLLPGTVERYGPMIVFAVDTSGSMSTKTLEEIYGVIKWTSKRMTTKILQCDAEIQSITNKIRFTDKIEVKGRGGTSFVPVFKFIEKEYKNNIDLLVYGTDLYGTFPKEIPKYKTIWIVPEDSNEKPPFGQIIKIKEEK